MHDDGRMSLNTRSEYLTILVATYNRLESLRIVVDAIQAQTRRSHELIVIDGGSNDGTIEYLQSRDDITPVFQGRLLGVPNSYNEVWRQVESLYTCWLSDDTELINNGIDLAAQILEEDESIGMVGLKTRDVIGPRAKHPYVGAISEYGILNCNHAVMPLKVLRSVGFFNEDYPMYMVDPDLTASILCAGKKVVMTRQVCVLHRPEWAVLDRATKKEKRLKGVDHMAIYKRKFYFLYRLSLGEKITSRIRSALRLPALAGFLSWAFGLNSRDLKNLLNARFISLFDPLTNACKPYHNVQRISRGILYRENNPYRKLI